MIKNEFYILFFFFLLLINCHNFFFKKFSTFFSSITFNRTLIESSLALSNHNINNNVLHNITKRSSNDQQENVKLICYYSNWAIYRPGVARFTPQNINPFLCVSIIVFNFQMNTNNQSINWSIVSNVWITKILISIWICFFSFLFEWIF